MFQASYATGAFRPYMPSQGNANSSVFSTNGFYWPQNDARALTLPVKKRFIAEVPSNNPPAGNCYPYKTLSLEFSKPQPTQTSVQRCYSQPLANNQVFGNFGSTWESQEYNEDIKRKIPQARLKATLANNSACTERVPSIANGGAQSPDRVDQRKRPAFCPNILQMCIRTPSYLQQGKFNFRGLSGPTFDTQSREMTSLRWHIANSLRRHGVCVINRFMGTRIGENITQEVNNLHSDRVFTQGQTMGATAGGKSARVDLVTWLDGTETQYPSIRAMCAKLDDVVGCGTGVTENYAICGSTKTMVARYRGNGSGYRLHVDNPAKDGRCLSCIYYVNKGWDSQRMGGNLKLYAKTSGKTAEIQPIFDRIIFFYSDSRNPHEVLPTYKDRNAITVWYFDLSERARAIERLAASSTRM